MTDSTNNQPASKTPTHIAYHVRNREGGNYRRQAGGYSTVMSHADAMSHASLAR
jgi:hypothetical protein